MSKEDNELKSGCGNPDRSALMVLYSETSRKNPESSQDGQEAHHQHLHHYTLDFVC